MKRLGAWFLSAALAATLGACTKKKLIIQPPVVETQPASTDDENAIVKYAPSDFILFEYNSAELNDQARRVIQNKWFIDKPVRLTLEGHCDQRGTEAYNLVLGQRRADAVKDYLVYLGMDVEMIETISYGKEKPVCEPQEEAAALAEACYKFNRRVDFK